MAYRFWNNRDPKIRMFNRACVFALAGMIGVNAFSCSPSSSTGKDNQVRFEGASFSNDYGALRMTGAHVVNHTAGPIWNITISCTSKLISEEEGEPPVQMPSRVNFGDLTVQSGSQVALPRVEMGNTHIPSNRKLGPTSCEIEYAS